MYAVVRLSHHAGQLKSVGVDKDLWKTSNQELRNMLPAALTRGDGEEFGCSRTSLRVDACKGQQSLYLIVKLRHY
ncbi:hypothetical protein AGMMS49921_05780 [Endomicrobiia bacterium]|nr:hypothetical protein AGMMS49921_05780 [Endomicrobiia bacterium]